MIEHNTSTPMCVDFGCGRNKRSGSIGVDWVDGPDVDVVADLNDRLPFDDGAVDAAYCQSVLEHLNDPVAFMNEVHRILKPTGRLWVFVPHFSNPYGHSDPTHQHLFGLYSFQYFVEERRQHLRRKVPDHYTELHWEVEEVRLTFIGRTPIGKLVTRALSSAFNASPTIQEFYERYLCWHLACYAITATLSPVKG